MFGFLSLWQAQTGETADDHNPYCAESPVIIIAIIRTDSPFAAIPMTGNVNFHDLYDDQYRQG